MIIARGKSRSYQVRGVRLHVCFVVSLFQSGLILFTHTMYHKLTISTTSKIFFSV
jgi:hypothetical protein